MSRDRLTGRASDERLLRMLELRHNGMSAVAIGMRFGKIGQFVTTATNRARRADLDESGEPPGIVNLAYW